MSTPSRASVQTNLLVRAKSFASRAIKGTVISNTDYTFAISTLVLQYISFIPSQRNKSKLDYNGFIYVCDRKNENKSYWKCEISDCKGKCIKHDNVIEETKVHCHGPDPVNIEVGILI